MGGSGKQRPVASDKEDAEPSLTGAAAHRLPGSSLEERRMPLPASLERAQHGTLPQGRALSRPGLHPRLGGLQPCEPSSPQAGLMELLLPTTQRKELAGVLYPPSVDQYFLRGHGPSAESPKPEPPPRGAQTPLLNEGRKERTKERTNTPGFVSRLRDGLKDDKNCGGRWGKGFSGPLL